MPTYEPPCTTQASSTTPASPRPTTGSSRVHGAGWARSPAPGLDAGPYGQIDDDASYTHPWGCDPTTITAPILLQHGTADRIIPPSHGSWLAAHCPTATLQLHEGASHFTIVEHAEEGLEWLATQS